MLFGRNTWKSNSPALCLKQAIANTCLGTDSLDHVKMLSTVPPTPYLLHLSTFFCSCGSILFASNVNVIKKHPWLKKKAFFFSPPDFLSLIRSLLLSIFMTMGAGTQMVQDQVWACKVNFLCGAALQCNHATLAVCQCKKARWSYFSSSFLAMPFHISGGCGELN